MAVPLFVLIFFVILNVENSKVSATSGKKNENWRKQLETPFIKTSASILESRPAIWRGSGKEPPKKAFPIKP